MPAEDPARGLDAAALRNIELLPWDLLGRDAGARRSDRPRPDGLSDRLATQAPDGAFAELRQLVGEDYRLRVPRAVHNAARQRGAAL